VDQAKSGDTVKVHFHYTGKLHDGMFFDTAVAFDANHPPAGKDLTFDIQLVGIA